MRTYLLIAIILLIPTRAQGEAVLLKTGRIIEGTLVEKTPEHIRLQVEDELIKIPFRNMEKDFATAYMAFPDMAFEIPDAVPTYKGREIFTEEFDTAKFLNDAVKKYKAMQAFQCIGVGISNINYGHAVATTQKFVTIKLQRPNLYLVTDKTTLAPGVIETRAAWHDGINRSYFNSNSNKYIAAPDNDFALIGVNNVRILADIFFGCNKKCPLTDDFTYLGTIAFNGDDHHLFEREISTGSQVIWISKTQNLITRLDHNYKDDRDAFLMRMLPMEKITKIFQSLGVALTKENRDKFLQVLDEVNFRAKTSDTETFSELVMDNIVLDVNLDKAYYRFPIQDGPIMISADDLKKKFE